MRDPRRLMVEYEDGSMKGIEFSQLSPSTCLDLSQKGLCPPPAEKPEALKHYLLLLWKNEHHERSRQFHCPALRMLAEKQQREIAEMQEQRASEDHAHIIETHQLMMRALANQAEEIQDLKALIAEMQGKVYERRPAPALPDLRSLHPRGVERFAKSRRRRLEQ